MMSLIVRLTFTMSLVICFIATASSQILTESDNSSPGPQTVEPHKLTKGAVSHDVNLFNGSYSMSYPLGTVASPSGLSYSVNMNYSPSTTVGSNVPYVNGVPYGDGWSVDVPTITIDAEVFRTHTSSEWDLYLSNPLSSDLTFTTEEAAREGRLHYTVPTLNIPGVASGRMVFKERKGVSYVFTLNTFSGGGYVEAILYDSNTWSVRLPNGDIYEFPYGYSKVTYRPDKDGKPQEQILCWYPSEIYNDNYCKQDNGLYTEKIVFEYNYYGCFDQFRERFNPRDFVADGGGGGLAILGPDDFRKTKFKACEEILLKSVSVYGLGLGSPIDKVELNYETLSSLPTGILDPHDSDTENFDDMYCSKVVEYWGGTSIVSNSTTLFSKPSHLSSEDFSSWNRYRHWRSGDVTSINDPAFYTGQGTYSMHQNNPYLANSGPALSFVESAGSNSSVTFDHSYFESERIDMSNMPTGDRYEVRSFIKNDNVNNGDVSNCSFDINVVTGWNNDPSNTSASHEPNFVLGTSGRASLDDGFRDYSIFSTFGRATKWNTYDTWSRGTLVTSNFFTLPYLPSEADGFHIQIGPANADIKYNTATAGMNVGSFNGNEDVISRGGGGLLSPVIPDDYEIPMALRAYYKTPNPLRSAASASNPRPLAPISKNFGIGLPWYSELGKYHQSSYALMELNPFLRTWWNDAGAFGTNPTNCTYPCWDNKPTRADEDVHLEGVALIRYSKTAHMLKSVKHYRQNGTVDISDPQLELLSQTEFEYSHSTINMATPQSSGSSMPSYVPDVPYYHVYFLSAIKEIPVDPTLGNSGFTYTYSEVPTTRFEYANLGALDQTQIKFFAPGSVFAIDKITDQLGGVTELDYYDLQDDDESIFYPRVQGKDTDPNNFVLTEGLTSWLKNMNVYQVIPVVKEKKVYPDGSVDPKVWSYNYNNKRSYDVPTSLVGGDNNFSKYLFFRRDIGFTQVTVQEPAVAPGQPRPYSKYFFHTDSDIQDYEQLNGLFGKLYKTENYDPNGNLERRTETEFTVSKAFANGIFRDKSNHIYRRYDDISTFSTSESYEIQVNGQSYPRPGLISLSVKQVGDNLIGSQPFDSYFVRKTKETVTEYFYKKNSLTLSPANPQFPANPTPPFPGNPVVPVSPAMSSLYFKVIPSLSGANIGDLTANELAVVTAVRGVLTQLDLVPRRPTFGGSYSLDCEIQNITEYEYWDADHTGKTVCNGYYLLNGVSYNPSSPIQLSIEPSWELYRTKSYSPQEPGKYNTTENFYYFDLANDMYALSSSTRDDLDGLIKSLKYGMRNIAYEIRNTFADNGEVVRKSTYYHYDARWPEYMRLNTSSETFYEDCSEPTPPPPPSQQPYNDCGCYSIKITDVAHYPGAPDGWFLYDVPFGDGWLLCPEGTTTEFCLQGIEEAVNGGEAIFNDVPKWAFIQHFATRNPPIYIEYDAVNDKFTFDPNEVNTLEDEIEALGGVLLLNQLENPLLTTFETEFDDADLSPVFREIDTDWNPWYTVNVDPGMTHALLLRSISVQVHEFTESAYLSNNGSSLAGEQLITRFPNRTLVGPDPDANYINMPDIPFKTILGKKILERNRFRQTQLEENEYGLPSFYTYNEPSFTRYTNTYPDDDCGNHMTLTFENYGIPSCIIKGSDGVTTRPDALETCFEFYPNLAVNTITDPNGVETSYTYDEYGRMKESYLNGDRLTLNKYSYWKGTATTAIGKTLENYVDGFVFYEPSATEALQTRSYMDPLGREYATLSQVTNDADAGTNAGVMINSGTMVYNGWDQVTEAYAPFEVVHSGTPVFEPVSNLSSGALPQHKQVNTFENSVRKRPLKMADYTIDINSSHVTSYAYGCIDGGSLSSKLGLTQTEEDMIMPAGAGSYTFLWETVTDPDGKWSTTYTNAAGEKVAMRQPIDNSTTNNAITLFGYDAQGNLTKVINPKKQESEYKFNLLGLMYEKTTVDGGTTKYMFDGQGKLAFEEDDNARNGSTDVNHNSDYIRQYDYDDFGRMVLQQRFNVDYSASPESHPMYYADATGDPFTPGKSFDLNDDKFSVSSPIKEKEFRFNTIDVTGLYPHANASVFINYNSTDPNQHLALGKPTVTVSYNDAGQPVHYNFLSYNEDGRLNWEIQQFREGGLVDGQTGDVIRIDYPEYNLQGSLLTKNVDVYCDNTLDLQYHYAFDMRNRLQNVYMNHDNSEGNLIAQYTYDDVWNRETSHWFKIDGQQAVYQVDNAYDLRNRLTSISSDLFTWNMFYDDDHPFNSSYSSNLSASKNWNGNINATEALYSVNTYLTSENTFDNKSTVYGYHYDKLNRLTGADGYITNLNTERTPTILSSAQAQMGDVGYFYDKVGNITTLYRRDFTPSGTTVNTDNYHYYYAAGTNRLVSVNRNSVNESYTYDDVGNLLTDQHKGLTVTNYGRANLPVALTMPNSVSVDYLYDATDNRMFKKHDDGTDVTEEFYLKDATGQTVGIWQQTDDEWTWYISGGQRIAKYVPETDQQPANAGAGTISVPYFDNGGTNTYNLLTSTTVGNNMWFYLYDHLGNTRVGFDPTATGSSISYSKDNLNVYDYYPFGKILRQRQSAFGEKYLTTYHERDAETDLDYRGARFYDSDIARFLSLDPLAIDYPTVSDYVYVLDNPIIMIDRDGRAPDIVIKGDNCSSVTIKTDLIDVSVDASSIVGDLGGNFTLDGEDILVAGLDIAGVVDPTPTTDAISAGIEYKNGNYFGGTISAIAVVPYIGDVGKLAKIPRHLKTINKAIDGIKTSKFAKRNPLPALDGTGKVHGSLPSPGDLNKYSREELENLKDELGQSVQKRIEVTSEMGSDRPHGQRQGSEQDLIKSIEKYLEDN